MFTPKVRVTGIVFASLLLIASGVWFSSGDSPKAQAAEAKAAKLMDLLKEKLSTLQEEASRMTKLHQHGGWVALLDVSNDLGCATASESSEKQCEWAIQPAIGTACLKAAKQWHVQR